MFLRASAEVASVREAAGSDVIGTTGHIAQSVIAKEDLVRADKGYDG